MRSYIQRYLKMSKVIDEIRAGNGNQYSVKEILQEHIRRDEMWKDADLEWKSTYVERHATNRTAIKYISIGLGAVATMVGFIIKKIW